MIAVGSILTSCSRPPAADLSDLIANVGGHAASEARVTYERGIAYTALEIVRDRSDSDWVELVKKLERNRMNKFVIRHECNEWLVETFKAFPEATERWKRGAVVHAVTCVNGPVADVYVFEDGCASIFVSHSNPED